ncbi:MAG: [NiFe]-hydrogenase assembly chaperone HybE [Gammaproteobacteria bacterium]|nr:[NiFe]-hydrogenase assembly chaperone HybE [Gammaproteobacteria bacterium]
MDTLLSALSDELVHHFCHIEQTRMQGVPILNPALQVEAVGFHRRTSGYLGILITPWFMNLVLLPCEGDQWQELVIGSTQNQVFASGRYQFLLNEAEEIGRYQSCSLLSPVLELDSQETARAVAVAALEALQDEECRDNSSSTHATEIEQQWYQPAETPPETDSELSAPIHEADNTPVVEKVALEETEQSRRDFLRGQFRSASNEPPKAE